jgi:hypothetical protein
MIFVFGELARYLELRYNRGRMGYSMLRSAEIRHRLGGGTRPQLVKVIRVNNLFSIDIEVAQHIYWYFRDILDVKQMVKIHIVETDKNKVK